MERHEASAEAAQRNDLVAALADAVWVPHAALGGKTWVTIRAALGRQQPVFAFSSEENDEIFEAGAHRFAELLENTIKRYQNRDIEMTQIFEELITLAKDRREVNRRGPGTGLDGGRGSLLRRA